MTVSLVDKRRKNQRICEVGMPNGTWFKVLDIPGMAALTDIGHTCDSATATQANAKKMAALIEAWTPPDGWVNGNDKEAHERMKDYIVFFLRNCNGFRTR